MYRWAWNRRIRTKNAAIALKRLENRLTRLAFIEPLAGICRHGFSFDMPAIWASQRRLKNDYCCLRCHIAYPVSMRNPASMGSNIASLYITPNNPVRPKAVRTIGSSGVKQHSAARTVPPIPNASNLFFISVTFVILSGICSLKFDLH